MKVLLGALLGLAALTACGTGSTGDSAGDSPGAGDDGLAGRTFLSTTVSGSSAPLVAGTRVSLTFADGQLSASAGCNTMGGDYRLDGGALRLPESLFMTEMGCDEPRMAQDEWVSAFLGGDPSYELDGDQLTLTKGETTLELVDEEEASPDADLVGTTWVLEGIVVGSDETGAVSSIPAGVRSTLQITPSGWLRLHPGCNPAGRAQVAVGDDTLAIGPLPVTRMGCLDGSGDVERVVLGVLQPSGDVTWAIDDKSLTLRRGATGLLYRAEG